MSLQRLGELTLHNISFEKAWFSVKQEHVDAPLIFSHWPPVIVQRASMMETLTIHEWDLLKLSSALIE